MHSSGEEASFWSREPTALASDLQSGPDGLETKVAVARLAELGPNSVEDTARLGALRLLLRQFESPLVLILVFAAVVSLVLQQWIDASIILAIVLGSSLLGFVQEYQASAAVAALKKRLALTARVIRDGKQTNVPVSQIVPGDLVLLSAGNLVPADGLVLEAQDFLVSEASLTGESFPVEKRPGVLPADTALAGRTNAVFVGASVRSGTARILAVRTGRRTEFGAIAARLRARPPETDFARGVRQFGYLLVRVMVVIVLFVLTVNLLLHRPVIDSLLFAVALAVGLSPELLPAIVIVTLSAGARAMARSGVIVRRLEAIENLGSMDTLCTDKTGTLTEGTIVLEGAYGPENLASEEVRRLAFLNASFETGIENPLDTAIVAAGKATGLLTEGFTKVDEIPYDFIRRRLTIVVAADETPAIHLMITKGAFASVLGLCTSVMRDGKEVDLDPASTATLEEIFKARGNEGYRVLALATRPGPTRPGPTRPGPTRTDVHDKDEARMTFRGFLVFNDPPKADAARTVHDLNALGIRIKVVSGDNRYVTAHLARSIGLDETALLTGEDLARMNDEALWHLAPRTDLFVEIDPQAKERIVRALQRTGHCVGYLGDGINDAPALHAADVGMSVEAAVDVARESADIILLRRDLDVLRAGVEIGRRTFANTLKYIAITTSANFGNMVSMALATPVLPFMPLVAKQILLNNFLSSVPAMAISGDNVDAQSVAGPQRWSIRDIRRFMMVFGLVSSVFDLVTFAVLLLVFHAGAAVFQTSWFVISLLTELAVVMILRTHGPAFASRPGRVLGWSTLGIGVICFAVPFAGPAASMFGFVPLSLPEMAAVVAIVLGYSLATEVAKRLFFRAVPAVRPPWVLPPA